MSGATAAFEYEKSEVPYEVPRYNILDCSRYWFADFLLKVSLISIFELDSSLLSVS